MVHPHCRATEACVAKTQGGRCRRCAMLAVCTADHLNRWRQSPEGREIQRQRAIDRLARINTPEAIAARTVKVRQQRLGWCPADRQEEYMALARRMPAAEARAFIEDDIRIKAQRELRRSVEEMEARHQRQIAQAY